MNKFGSSKFYFYLLVVQLYYPLLAVGNGEYLLVLISVIYLFVVQVTVSPEDYQDYVQRPQELICRFIKARLNGSSQ